jgi:hypothetical protein
VSRFLPDAHLSPLSLLQNWENSEDNDSWNKTDSYKAVDSPVLHLFLTRHHIERSGTHLSLAGSSCIRIIRTTFLASAQISSFRRRESKLRFLHMSLTGLQHRNRWAPSSFRRWHIGQRGSTSIPRRWILHRWGRLLCAILHRTALL